MDVLFFYYFDWDEVIGVLIKPGDWIAKTPEMAVEIGDTFMHEIFRSTIVWMFSYVLTFVLLR